MLTSSQFIDWHLTSFSVKVTVIFKDVEALIDRLIKMTKYLTRFIFGRHQEGLFMSSMTLRLKRRTFGWRAPTQVKAEGKVTDDDGLSGKRNSAHGGSKLQKPAKNLILKIREIDNSYL